MTSMPAHPPPKNAIKTHQNETIGSLLLALMVARKIAPRLRCRAISGIVTDLQSSSGVDFSGMQESQPIVVLGCAPVELLSVR